MKTNVGGAPARCKRSWKPALSLSKGLSWACSKGFVTGLPCRSPRRRRD